MKIAIKENEYNPTLLYQDFMTEEMAIEQGYHIENIDERFADCVYEDFNADFSFSEEKYNKRKEELKKLQEAQSYKNEICSIIREKYSIDDELAIIRQKDTKPEEFEEYNNFAESAKRQAREKQGENL